MSRKHCNWVHRAACVAAVVAAGVIGSAQGAPISWGAPTQIAGDADVSTAGTLVGAFNVGGAAAAVNGVAFQAGSGGSSGGVNFTLTHGFGGPTSTGSASAPFASLGAGYRALLGTADYDIGAAMTLAMSGLTAGGSYLFQTWVNDSRSQIPPGFTFDVEVDDGAGNTARLDPNTTLFDGGLGQFLIGSFVAAAGGSQTITFRVDEVAILNGYQLRSVATSVPEPATLALMGMALAALGVRRRSA